MGEHLLTPPLQLPDIKDVFRLYDSNGDGSISMEELGNVLNLLGQGCTEIELGETIRYVDKDGNGAIEFEEFILVMKQANASMTYPCEEYKDEMKRAFCAFDKDQNGFISSDELFLVMKSLGGMPSKEDVQDMIKQADMDGDGFINCNEFLGIMM